MENNKILKHYNKAVKKLAKINDTIINLQREKDYKVTKIDQQYRAKIDNNLVQHNQLEKIITLTKSIIGAKEIK